MTLETYWFVTPLVLLGLSGFGWLALWLTRGHAPEHQPSPAKPKR